MKVNTIINGDCLDTMRTMPDGCVDLVVTSPPYNLLNSTGGYFRWGKTGGIWSPILKDGYDGYGDNMPHGDYVEWQRACISEMLRLVPDNGAVFYNHKSRPQGGQWQDRDDITSGFPLRQIVIWDRCATMNFNANFIPHSYEQIYIFAKPKFKFNKNANQFQSVWRIPPEHNNEHPAPFPIALAQRAIHITDAQTILDPFGGSGTTAIAAMKEGRNYILIEKSAKYCQMAGKRIENFSNQKTLL